MEIDLVYLWVDDTDFDWKKKFNKYRNVPEQFDADAVDICRFYNNDELKYSLRSVEKNAPWINKIFIITDNQVPSWLNVDNPKIRIVDHSEIIPKDKLPLFNSCAIESRIPFIKDLSEYFLYANDDTFIWDTIDKDFFFENNKLVVRVEKFLKKGRKYNSLYGMSLLNTYNIFRKKYKSEIYAFYPHHNIDIYKKSLFINCINDFKNEFEDLLLQRFRTSSDVQRCIVAFYMLMKNEAVLKIISRNFIQKIFKMKTDSMIYSLKGKHLPKLIRANTKLMCINDNQRTTVKDRENIKKILEEKFSEKSSFEK